MTVRIATFKRLIVVFWAVWWLIAFLTDFIGVLKVTGVVNLPWFKVGNYADILSTITPFHLPAWLAPILYGGIVIWSFASVVLFLRAAATSRQPLQRWQRHVDAAFIVSLGLWFAFFIADQIFLQFDLEQNHMVQGGFQLLCFIALYVLPDDD